MRRGGYITRPEPPPAEPLFRVLRHWKISDFTSSNTPRARICGTMPPMPDRSPALRVTSLTGRGVIIVHGKRGIEIAAPWLASKACSVRGSQRAARRFG